MYIFISCVFVVIAFALGVWAKHIEINEKYVKPTVLIATKRNKKTKEICALTLYYDKNYFDFEDRVLAQTDRVEFDEVNELDEEK